MPSVAVPSGVVRSLLARWLPEATWTVLAIGVVLVGLLASDGEPICEGPFIVSVNDSFPPQCPSPLAAVPWVAAVWLLGLVLIIGTRAVV